MKKIHRFSLLLMLFAIFLMIGAVGYEAEGIHVMLIIILFSIGGGLFFASSPFN